jgi:hypothetical protein
LSARLQIPTGDVAFMSEISFPPYGYLFTVNSPKPDDRLLDITGWCNYRYDGLVEIEIKMTVLPTYLLYPGDYRTKDKIMKAKENHNYKNA